MTMFSSGQKYPRRRLLPSNPACPAEMADHAYKGGYDV